MCFIEQRGKYVSACLPHQIGKFRFDSAWILMFMSWVSENELYALIGLAVNLDHTPSEQVAPDLWAFTNNEFEIPSHWQEWLGKFRVEDIDDSNLFLLCKVKKPQGTYDRLFSLAQRRVMNFTAVYCFLRSFPLLSRHSYFREKVQMGRPSYIDGKKSAGQ